MRASLQLLLLLGLLGPAQGQLCTPTSAEEAIISFTGATTKHDNLGGYGCGWGYNPGCIESGTSGVCPTSTTQLADFTSGDLTPASGWPSTGLPALASSPPGARRDAVESADTGVPSTEALARGREVPFQPPPRIPFPGDSDSASSSESEESSVRRFGTGRSRRSPSPDPRRTFQTASSAGLEPRYSTAEASEMRVAPLRADAATSAATDAPEEERRVTAPGQTPKEGTQAADRAIEEVTDRRQLRARARGGGGGGGASAPDRGGEGGAPG